MRKGHLSCKSERKIRRPLTHEELESFTQQKESGENYLNTGLEKISLKDVSLEERRKEAGKPLYLLRYE